MSELEVSGLNPDSREINRDYFQTLGVNRRRLFGIAQSSETRNEFMDTFDHIIRINRIQLGLLTEIYPFRVKGVRHDMYQMQETS